MARHGLVARLSLLIAVMTALLMAAALAILLVQGGRAVVQRETRELEQSARLYAAAARQSLQDAAGSMEILAALSAAMPLEDSQRLAQEILEHSTLLSLLVLTNPLGEALLVLPSGQPGASFQQHLAHASWFAELVDLRRTVVGDLLISPIDQRPTIVVASPVRGTNGSFAGAWVGELDLGRLSALRRLPEEDESNRAGFLTDRRGLVIAHQGNPRFVAERTDFSSVPPVQEALSGKAGVLRYRNRLEQADKIGAFLPLEISPGSPPWAAVYAVTARYAFGQLNSLARGILGLGLLLTALISGLTVFTLRRFLRPLHALVASAGRIGAGDFTDPPPLHTGDELEALAAAFRGMAQSLRRKDGQLRRQLTELQASNRELEAFSYSVSHDLRAPLRSIDGFSMALLEDYAEVLPEEGREYLAFLRESSQQMGQLIDDLIRLSRLTRDEFHAEEVDLSGLARKAVDELRARDPKRSVDIRIQPEVHAIGDSGLLCHVLQNLLGNAWKFTAPKAKARIEFGVSVGDEEVRYYVRDNGVGFDMAYADRLFSPFQRLHAKSEFEGSGIGLATVQRVVRRHGGRVWAEAQANRGATFYFTLNEGEKT